MNNHLNHLLVLISQQAELQQQIFMHRVNSKRLRNNKKEIKHSYNYFNINNKCKHFFLKIK
jgi:hypothetical protein